MISGLVTLSSAYISPMYSIQTFTSASFSKQMLSCLSMIPVVWVVFLRFVTLRIFSCICLVRYCFPPVLYFLTLRFQPVLFGYFECPFHLSVNLIVVWVFFALFRFSIMSRMSVLIQGFCFSSQSLAIYCVLPFVYLLLCSSIRYPLYPFHIIVLIPHVQDSQIYCLLRLRIAASYVHLSPYPD